MMRDRVTPRQRLEVAKDIWLYTKITAIYMAVAIFAVLYIFVLLKIIGVI